MPQPQARSRARMWWSVGLLLFIVLVIVSQCPTFPRSGEKGRATVCRSMLRQIARAMEMYHMVYGSLPPAYVVDHSRSGLYSWRVLMLPGLECAPAFDELHLDERWDSGWNRRVLETVPSHTLFQCPSRSHAEKQETGNRTDYVMVVGAGTVSDGLTSVRLEQITDGPENTIMLVETAGTHLHWAAPGDMSLNDLPFGVNHSSRQGIGSYHPGGAHVLFCDGKVGFLSESLNPEIIRGMCTIAGGEEVTQYVTQAKQLAAPP